MNPNSSESFQLMWHKLIKVWRQLDEAIEMFIQQTIEELEEIRQQK